MVLQQDPQTRPGPLLLAIRKRKALVVFPSLWRRRWRNQAAPTILYALIRLGLDSKMLLVGFNYFDKSAAVLRLFVAK